MRRLVAVLVLFSSVLAGCGGGGSTTAVPQAASSASASTGTSGTATVPTSAGTVTLPSANGVSAKLAIAAGAPANVTISATASATAPANAPAPSAVARKTQAVTGANGFYYVKFTVSAALPATYISSETVAPGYSPVAGTGYYAEFDDITTSATKILSAGPGTINGTSVTINNSVAGTGGATSTPFLPGRTYLLQFYETLATQGQQISSSPISHIIVVTMENRTPDNLMGNMTLVKGLAAEGAVNIKAQGGPSVGLESPTDPDHSYPALIAEWDNGKLDGFAADPLSPSPGAADIPPSYFVAGGGQANFVNGTVPESEVYVYETLMETYGFSDDFFSSRLVPSFPGHQFMVAGQSGGSDDPNSNVWGCDAPPSPSPLVTSFSANGTEAPGPLVSPCFSYNSLATLLDAKQISWRYYTGAPQTDDGNIDAYGAISPIRYGPDWQNNISIPLTNLTSDIQNCNLPSVSYINAPAFASDHSGTLSAGGPGFVGDLYLQLIQTLQNANANCQYYNNTTMLVTWDDAGGWSDHVAPPKDSVGNSYGFRVPFIAISPYVSAGYLAGTAGENSFVLDQITAKSATAFYDYGSILLYIENNFNLGAGALGTRDLDALNRGGDFTPVLFNYTRKPIAPLAGLLLTDFKRNTSTADSKARLAYPNEPVDDDK